MLAFIEEECNINSSHPEMDQREDQIQKRLMNNKKQFLKRTLQFVSSVSLFCIFVWYSSSGFSMHPQYSNAYFSTCLLSMFTHTLQRKYMFLICNGILAFLAKNLRSHNSDHFELHASNYNLSETKAPVSDDDMLVVAPLRSFESPEKVPLMDHEEEQVEWHCTEELSSEAQEEEEGTLCAQNEASNIAEEEKKIKHRGIDDEEGGAELSEVNKVEQDDDDDVVVDDDEVAETTMTTNELEKANTEELNRKFEEFIRKMKEEMRIEAQRQLIAV